MFRDIFSEKRKLVSQDKITGDIPMLKMIVGNWDRVDRELQREEEEKNEVPPGTQPVLSAEMYLKDKLDKFYYTPKSKLIDV